MVQAGHAVLATSRGDYTSVAEEMGVSFFRDADDFCERHPDVVVLATSILSLRGVLGGLPLQRLRRSTLFVDVLSVKTFPRRALLETLPRSADVLCTHPMFGPDSGSGSWSGLNFMYECVRLNGGETRRARLESFLAFFQDQGCRMVPMTCAEHDRQAASSQFIAHTVGRVLGAMGLERTAIDTKGYASLLDLVDNTAHDSFDLYYGLFLYNPEATQQLNNLERALDEIKGDLMRKLRDALHARLGEGAGEAAVEVALAGAHGK